MARQIINNGESGLSVRTKINENFAELYGSLAVSVKDYGAIGDGVANDTAAIQAAVNWARSQTRGASVFFPRGTYLTDGVDCSNSNNAEFEKTIRLYGEGRFLSVIKPRIPNTVMLNLQGRNNAIVEKLMFDSTGTTNSQCAIFMARTTESGNCNNNTFIDLFCYGGFTKACVVSLAAESNSWDRCRFWNNNVPANHRTFYTSTRNNEIAVLPGFGTAIEGPNTDNTMVDCEFYAPFEGARVVQFARSAGYSMVGCSVITGVQNNARLVTYSDPVSGRWQGSVTWTACHFEGFGNNSAVHYLDQGSGEVIWHGIKSIGGYYVISDNDTTTVAEDFPFMDYDRQTLGVKPILENCTFTTPSTPPNSTGSRFYAWGLYSSTVDFTPNNADGNVHVFGTLIGSTVRATTFTGPAQRFVNCTYTVSANAIPTTGTWTQGTTIVRETPVVGQPTGWKVTVSGTLGTLSGKTGSITSGTNVLTVNNSSGMSVGQVIDVAGSSNGPYRITKIVGNVCYLDLAAGATVSGAAVTYFPATLVALQNL